MSRLKTAIARGRLVYGAALVLAPDALLGALDAGEVDGRARTFARVLGARQVAEAALVGPGASARRIRVGAAVDGIHALTMVALAGLDRRRRRLATVNALIASALALAGVVELRRR
ncbi:MAG TPA: hypothetical protein VKV21_00205 [Solirubrobacteraceae bacterium]|nr:hypothetical protein [Solirubrobacteraceae bacterium]